MFDSTRVFLFLTAALLLAVAPGPATHHTNGPAARYQRRRSTANGSMGVPAVDGTQRAVGLWLSCCTDKGVLLDLVHRRIHDREGAILILQTHRDIFSVLGMHNKF